MTDEYEDDMPATPVAKVRKHVVEDKFEYDVAVNLGFVGVGQGGGRLAEAFFKIGYGRVGVINTAYQDLQELDPGIERYDVGTGGAGKDIEKARAAVNDKDEQIWSLLVRAIGNDPDYILICAGLGGGTGSGATTKVIEVARKYMEHLGKSPKRVGAIVSLPMDDEGQAVCRNAVKAFESILKLSVSPMIIIDNKRINDLFEAGVSQIYGVANSHTARLLHSFNRLAVQHGSIVAFDPEDFIDLLDSGIAVFGASQVEKYQSPADISDSIRNQLGDTTLANVDLSRGRKAACLFIGGEAILDQVPMDFFGNGLGMLNRLLAEGSTVHRGIFKGSKPDLRCYTMLSALPPPTKRLQQLATLGGLNKSQMASFLGIDDGEP